MQIWPVKLRPSLTSCCSRAERNPAERHDSLMYSRPRREVMKSPSQVWECRRNTFKVNRCAVKRCYFKVMRFYSYPNILLAFEGGKKSFLWRLPPFPPRSLEHHLYVGLEDWFTWTCSLSPFLHAWIVYEWKLFSRRKSRVCIACACFFVCFFLRVHAFEWRGVCVCIFLLYVGNDPMTRLRNLLNGFPPPLRRL